MQWWLLALAVVLEVTGTMALSVAARGRRAWFVLVVTAYAGSFASLAGALSQGLELGVAYGIWAASGVALTAVGARVLFQEPLTRTMGCGIALVAAGVLLVEVGRH